MDAHTEASPVEESSVERELRASLAALMQENDELKAILKRVSANAIHMIAMKNLALKRLLDKRRVEVQEKANGVRILDESSQHDTRKNPARPVPKTTSGGLDTASGAASNEDTLSFPASVASATSELLPCIPVGILHVSDLGDQDSQAVLHRPTTQEATI